MGCGTTKTARQNAAERNLWTSLDIVVGGGEARRDAARHVAPRRRPKVAEQRHCHREEHPWSGWASRRRMERHGGQGSCRGAVAFTEPERNQLGLSLHEQAPPQLVTHSVTSLAVCHSAPGMRGLFQAERSQS